MHNIHTPTYPLLSAHTEAQPHTEWCAVGTVDGRCRAPLPKALLIGIKFFWWGRLLIRLELHASKMWRLFRPAQGPIDQGMAILSVYVCVRLCVFVCLSLVITLKTSWHWLELGPSGSTWPHSDMFSIGGRTRLVLCSELHAPATTHIRQNVKMQLTKLAKKIFYLGVRHKHRIAKYGNLHSVKKK